MLIALLSNGRGCGHSRYNQIARLGSFLLNEIDNYQGGFWPIWCDRCMIADDSCARGVSRGEAAEILALGALDWLLGSARSTAAGLTWTAAVPCSEAVSF
jgi:hypothetical protein